MKNLARLAPFLIGLVLTLSLLWPLLAAPFFTHHDDVQVIRLYEMNSCFKDGQIPCRWVPDLGGLYGYPIFNYYAPLPYYFGELAYLITGSLIVSVKIMFAFPFIGAYYFMFLFARKFWGDWGGSLSAVFYSFIPYHGLDFYVRGAMGEMWGLMFFPALLWSLSRLHQKINIGNTILFAVFTAGILTSHNLSAMLFLPILILWIVFLFFQRRAYKFLFFTLAALSLGISLSGFYIVPMLFEKNLVHVETTTYGYFSYTEHFKGLRKLILERSWGWGASVREVPGGQKDGMSFQIGWIHLLGWVLSLVAAYKLWNKMRFLSLSIFLSSGIIIFSIFMVNPRSEFIWRAIEPLKYLQFPWRFLMITSFFISFCVGSFVVSIEKKKLWWGVLITLVVAFNFLYFRPEKFLQVKDNDLLVGENWDKQIKRSIFDYLPIYAKEPPAELAKERYQVLTGDSRVFDFRSGTNWINFKTETKTHTIIRISQYYFPNWKVFIDGKEGVLEYKNNNLGLMTIILGEGDHEISLKLFDTRIRSFANTLTLATAIFVVLLFIIHLGRVRSWLEYYRKRIY